MAIDIWTGNGDWTLESGYGTWSAGVPVAATVADIGSGTVTLSTTGVAADLLINSGADMVFGDSATLTIGGWLRNSGGLYVTGNGDHISLGGALDNSGLTVIGTTTLTSSTTVTALGLNNVGTLIVQGNAASGTTDQAELNVTKAINATLTGNVEVLGDGDLNLRTKITTIGNGASLLIGGAEARVSLNSGSPTANSDLVALANNDGALALEGNYNGAGGTSLTTTVGLANTGTVGVDNDGYSGGSTETFGGTLTNDGTIYIGNNNLSASTSVTATGFANSGTLFLNGNLAEGTADQAVLDITGTVSPTEAGYIRVEGDADLQLGSQFTTVGTGGWLEVDGGQAFMSLGNGTTNSALSGLSVNNGVVAFQGNFDGNGGVSLATTTSLANNGTLLIDSSATFPSTLIAGGSNITIGGTLTNMGTTSIGGTSLTASVSVTASGLSNGGTLRLQGGTVTTQQAVLDITGAVSSTEAGYIRVMNDADLQLASQFTTVAIGGWLELDGGQAFMSLGDGTTNSALSGLSVNNGIVALQGDFSGSGGVSLTTTTGLANNGTLLIDSSFGFPSYLVAGGSNITIGGTLTNTGTTSIGGTSLTASTSVTAGGLSNGGTLYLEGNAGNGTTDQATLDITGSVSATVTGIERVVGDADLILANQLTTVAASGFLQVDGNEARISIGAGSTNSALASLATNYGITNFDGNCDLGYGGGTVVTTTSFTNFGTLWIDKYLGDGGTTVSFGGTLTNQGLTLIGNTSLGTSNNTPPGTSTSVTATSLSNSGTIDLEGNDNSGTTYRAILDITGSNSATATGYMGIGGDADLQLVSKLTTVGNSAFLGLAGPQAVISIGNATTNTGLTALSANYGTFQIDGSGPAGGTSVSTTVAMANHGTLWIDYDGNDGGSSVSFGGALTNYNTIGIGNYNLSAASTVTASSLTNHGTITLTGSSQLGALVVNGAANNYATITIGSGAEVNITGSAGFTQNSGTTTVTGLLEASTLTINGGLLDFTTALTSGDGTGALDIGASGTLEFSASVDSSHGVSFTAATGTLELGTGASSSFAGTISGFSGSDVIDLQNVSASSLLYTGTDTAGTLTVMESGGATLELAFAGSYTTASFIMVPDGSGGTDILDPKTKTGAMPSTAARTPVFIGGADPDLRFSALGHAGNLSLLTASATEGLDGLSHGCAIPEAHSAFVVNDKAPCGDSLASVTPNAFMSFLEPTPHLPMSFFATHF